MSLNDYKGYGSLMERLSRSILSDRLAHAYIIEGDAISNKEAFARDFAKAILCKESPGMGCDYCSLCRRIEGDSYEDLYVVKPEGASVKDKQIQELQSNLMTLPSGEGRRNIAIIEDAETITLRAQNRLLKTLEEPTEGTIIMLLTGNSELLIPTVRSRCATIPLFGDGEISLSEEENFARDLVEMVYGGKYYYEITKSLDPYIKDQGKAGKLLDALERYMRRCMLDGPKETGIDRKTAYRNVKYIEEARKDLRYNVSAKYALRNLVVKIGGKDEAGSRS